MRRLFAIWLVACAGSCTSSQEPTAPAATPPALAVSIPAPPSEPVQFGAPVAPIEGKPRTPTRLWSGRPGVPIAAVFPTEDGSAAVSIDQANRTRLWPALDGTREPWVVPLAMPKQVAVIRAGDGFTLAAVDDSGGLEVAAITNAGELTTHVTIDPDPGFAAVVAIGDAFIALRRDQTLVQLDARGAAAATLLPPPGEHVMKLVHRKGRTLALVRKKDGVHGRWLAAAKLAWGDETAKLVVDLERVFLSPDHKRLLTFRADQPADDFGDFGPPLGESVLVDLATGRARPLRDPLSGNGPGGVPLGFTAEHEMVFLMGDFELSTLDWWSPRGYSRAVLGGHDYALELVDTEHAVLSDAGVFMSAGHELAIAHPNAPNQPSRVSFLGYRTSRASRLRGTPAGVVAQIGGGAALLDDHAHAAWRIPALDAISLDRDLALVKLGAKKKPRDEPEPRAELIAIDPEWLEKEWRRGDQLLQKERLALYDVARKQQLQQWPAARAFHYEAATQLLAIQRGSRVELAKLDPDQRKFGPPRVLATAATHVALLDPALAGGAIAVLARQLGPTVEVRTLDKLDGTLSAPSSLAGTLEAIDRAGRIYMREDAATIAVHAGEREPVRLAGLTGWHIRPSIAGAQLVAFARGRLSLFDGKGVELWSVGFPGITDAAWTRDGALFVLAGDIAKIDLANGGVAAAQCGWGFALRSRPPEPVDVPSTTETVCDR